jgi:hypothetical protein
MCGAAGIAAAKNRRTKADPNQKPIISCSTKTGGACPMPQQNNKGQQLQPQSSKSFVKPENLQITGPMPLVQVLAIHEQRLNKIDEELKQVSSLSKNSLPSVSIQPSNQSVECNVECNAECYDRIETLEEKIRILEEVIMNLQITITNVQSFSMETNLSLMKLQKSVHLNEQIQPKLQNISLSIKETAVAVATVIDTISEPVDDDSIVPDEMI